MIRIRDTLIWAFLTLALAVPIAAALGSPLLAWREPIYIAAGIAGVIALALMLLQPLLAAGQLPGFSPRRGQLLHRWIGGALVLAIAVHVIGLWITSPPDIIDALLLASPTPFSRWGVIAMWCTFVAACTAIFRSRLNLHPADWRRLHKTLAVVIVTTSVIHAILIEGTMEFLSKAALCSLVLLATFMALGKR